MCLFVLCVVIFYSHSPVVILEIPPGTENGCLENGVRQCCSGYFEMNNSCHECVGFSGDNCNNPCPSKWFGKRCMEECFCLEDLCDAVHGCPSGLTYIFEGSTTKVTQQINKAQLLAQFLKASPKEISTFRHDTDNSISHDKSAGFSLYVTPDLISHISNTEMGPWYYPENLKHFIQSFQTKDWIIFGIVVFILVIFTVFGVMKCRKSRKKMGMEHTHGDYIDLRRHAVSGDYSTIAENEYTEVKVYARINEETVLAREWRNES